MTNLRCLLTMFALATLAACDGSSSKDPQTPVEPIANGSWVGSYMHLGKRHDVGLLMQGGRIVGREEILGQDDTARITGSYMVNADGDLSATLAFWDVSIEGGSFLGDGGFVATVRERNDVTGT